MKKIMVTMIAFLPIFAMNGAFRQVGLLSRAAVLSVIQAKAGELTVYQVATQLQARRNFTEKDTRLLKGCSALGKYSPALGAFAIIDFPELEKPSLLSEWYTKESPLQPLVQHFFYQNPLDLKIDITRYDKDKVKAFPPALITALIRASGAGNFLTQEQKDIYISEWFERYKDIRKSDKEVPNYKNFHKRAKQFLNKYELLTEGLSHNQKTFVLLTVLYKVAQNKADFQSFARWFGIGLDPDDYYTESTFKEFDHAVKAGAVSSLSAETSKASFLEKCIFWKTSTSSFMDHGGGLMYPSGLLDVPRIDLGYKGSAATPLCVEEALRTIINCLFFDPYTKLFTFSVLPQEVQEACKKNNPRFYAFFQKYNDPSVVDYYKNSAREWLDLVSEIPHMDYKKRNFELVGNGQILRVVCHLLGISAVDSWGDLAQKVSTDARRLEFDFKRSFSNIFLRRDFSTPFLSTDTITIKVHKKNNCVEIGKAFFNEKHSFFKFAKMPEGLYKTSICDSLYKEVLSKNKMEYRPMSCVDLDTISFEDFKDVIDELLHDELKECLYKDFSKISNLQAVLYLLQKAKVTLSDFNVEKFIAHVLPTLREPIAEFLFTQKAVYFNTSYRTDDNQTYLHKACSNKHLSSSFIKLLISQDPSSINTRDLSNQSPLYIAVMAHNGPLTDFLLKQGADINFLNVSPDQLNLIDRGNYFLLRVFMRFTRSLE